MNIIFDRNNVAFDPLWVAEFRGFFAGEGSISIQIIHKKGNSYALFRPRCRISLRLDDHQVLREFNERIGGSLFYTNKQSSVGQPTLTWDASSLCHARIIRNLLQGSILPCKKFLEVPLWVEAVDILDNKIQHVGRGKSRFTDEQRNRLFEIAQLLKDYKVCKVQLPVK